MLTGLELRFLGVTGSNSDLVSTPGFVVSPVGKRERGGERKTHTHTHTHKNHKKKLKKEKKKTTQKNPKQRCEGGKKELGKEERKEGGKKE